jgi:hypothetical protein
MAEDTPPTTKQIGKAPISIRAKEDYVNFLNSLLPQVNNSPAAAIEHCIRVAMNGGGSPAPVNQDTLQELGTLRQKVKDLTAQLAAKPKPIATDALTFTADEQSVITKLVAKGKASTERQAVGHCIMYYKRNGWL